MALSGPEQTTYLAALREGMPADYRWGGDSRVPDLITAQTAATTTQWPTKKTVKW